MPELRSVAFTSGDGVTPIPSYLAVPDGAGPHPTVLILRGVAGPDDGYTEIAERLAGWGYAALMHGWKIRGDDPPDDLVYADMQGAIAYLRSVREADMTRLAVFGFCRGGVHAFMAARAHDRSEEHTSELQSQSNLVCRLLLEKKKKKDRTSMCVVKYRQ